MVSAGLIGAPKPVSRSCYDPNDLVTNGEDLIYVLARDYKRCSLRPQHQQRLGNQLDIDGRNAGKRLVHQQAIW